MNPEEPYEHVEPPSPAGYRGVDRAPAPAPESLTDEELDEVLAEGLTKYGAAFAAYLTIEGLPMRATLIREFVEDYAGTFPDMRTLLEETVEALGWDEPLRRFLIDEPQLGGSSRGTTRPSNVGSARPLTSSSTTASCTSSPGEPSWSISLHRAPGPLRSIVVILTAGAK